MAGSYSQIYLQIVFAVKGRQNLLDKKWRKEVFKYISGIIKGKQQLPLIVNGVSDHVHILVSVKPSIAVSDLVRDIKNNSSNFINHHNLVKGRFSWQSGFGVFSYNRTEVDRVIKYIENQEQHHKDFSFQDEYVKLLDHFDIEYQNEYLFNFKLTDKK